MMRKGNVPILPLAYLYFVNSSKNIYTQKNVPTPSEACLPAEVEVKLQMKWILHEFRETFQPSWVMKWKETWHFLDTPKRKWDMFFFFDHDENVTSLVEDSDMDVLPHDWMDAWLNINFNAIYWDVDLPYRTYVEAKVMWSIRCQFCMIPHNINKMLGICSGIWGHRSIEIR